ncbi:MAG: ABC transporter permease [Halodesulfurarchaeum sp.]
MNVDVDFSARQEVPRWLAYGSSVITILAALLVGSIALIAQNVNPIVAYRVMFFQPLTNLSGLASVLQKTAPLLLAGLAVYLPLRAGLWNIGATGQIYIGAIIGTWIGLNVTAPSFVLLPLMFLGAAVGGAIWGFIPGFLRAKWGVNEIIVSLLISYAAIDINGYLIRGPMQGGAGNFPVSSLLPARAMLPEIPVLGAHSGIIIAVATALLVYVVVQKTNVGYEITFTGSNPDAAEQAGMNSFWIYVAVFVVGGALAGMAGLIEIAGVQARLRPHFSPGYGFTAIVIALLGRDNALKVIIASLFFGLLFVGGTSLQVGFMVPAAIVEIIQALVILFLITAEFLKNYSVDIDLGLGESASQPTGTTEEV